MRMVPDIKLRPPHVHIQVYLQACHLHRCPQHASTHRYISIPHTYYEKWGKNKERGAGSVHREGASTGLAVIEEAVKSV